jgi:hypothetical protein
MTSYKTPHKLTSSVAQRQAAEKLDAGSAYQKGGYVLADELGEPWKTDQLNRPSFDPDSIPWKDRVCCVEREVPARGS